MTKLEESKVTVEQRIHPGWHKTIPEIIGKHQYIYSSDKGKISLVLLPNYFHDEIDLWEIYSLEGELFEDVERFESKEEAEERIVVIMGEK